MVGGDLGGVSLLYHKGCNTDRVALREVTSSLATEKLGDRSNRGKGDWKC